MTDRDQLADDFLDAIRDRHPGEDVYLQAVSEVARDVLPVERDDDRFAAAKVLERLTEPDRIVTFRVVWQDDEGAVQVNRGWRVQTSNAIGPYKGGLRFHPSVDLATLKFLGFEQVFKNALTGLPLGGGKGGADFDPSGRSEGEIMRFCQAFMGELAHHIGPETDVPAGDINVGPQEIGWLFGAYKRIKGQFHGALTGKGPEFGGSCMRVEATGYGLIYFVQRMLDAAGDDLEGKRVAISGKGNVATHAAAKAIAAGAKVVTLSDTSGTVLAEDGMTQDAVAWVHARKAAGDDVADPPDDLGVTFKEGATPWGQEAAIVLPCATQNEMDADAARAAIDAGAKLVAEGANMPLTADAVAAMADAGVLHAPGKAANAGGVAVSGLEMSQDRHGRFMTSDAVDGALREIMGEIHDRIAGEHSGNGPIDYRRGANVAGYRKVAEAIASYGIV